VRRTGCRERPLAGVGRKCYAHMGEGKKRTAVVDVEIPLAWKKKKALVGFKQDPYYRGTQNPEGDG